MWLIRCLTAYRAAGDYCSVLMARKRPDRRRRGRVAIGAAGWTLLNRLRNQAVARGVKQRKIWPAATGMHRTSPRLDQIERRFPKRQTFIKRFKYNEFHRHLERLRGAFFLNLLDLVPSGNLNPEPSLASQSLP
jgi:hypothetical protein